MVFQNMMGSLIHGKNWHPLFFQEIYIIQLLLIQKILKLKKLLKKMNYKKKEFFFQDIQYKLLT